MRQKPEQVYSVGREFVAVPLWWGGWQIIYADPPFRSVCCISKQGGALKGDHWYTINGEQALRVFQLANRCLIIDKLVELSTHVHNSDDPELF